MEALPPTFESQRRRGNVIVYFRHVMFVLVSLMNYTSSGPSSCEDNKAETHRLPRALSKDQSPIFLRASHQSLLSYSHISVTQEKPLSRMLPISEFPLRTTPRPFSLTPTWYTPSPLAIFHRLTESPVSSQHSSTYQQAHRVRLCYRHS